jgi:pyrroloquinoline quinone (PQQ) biosynthesis protein C
MTQDARQVIAEARREIASVEERIRQHPFLHALEARQVTREGLAIFAGQQRHIIESDLRSVALIVARAQFPAAREFFFGMLHGERAALQALEDFGSALGLSGHHLQAAEPLPGAFAYSAYVAWLALYGSTAEFAGAFLVNLDAWGANCGRMSRALQAGYGLTAKDVAFFDLFAAAPPGFEDQGIGVVDEGLGRGVDPGCIRRAARLLQGYEMLYWDAMLQVSGA